MAALTEFARRWRLRIRRDSDGTDIVPGRKGKSHLFEYDTGALAVMIMPETGSAHWWSAARAKFLAAGMQIRQNGDCEGTATFDPNNRQQVQLAMKYAGVKPKRQISSEQYATLVSRLKRPPEESVKTLQNAPLEFPRAMDRG
jgi:hypothetical protein